MLSALTTAFGTTSSVVVIRNITYVPSPGTSAVATADVWKHALHLGEVGVNRTKTDVRGVDMDRVGSDSLKRLLDGSEGMHGEVFRLQAGGSVNVVYAVTSVQVGPPGMYKPPFHTFHTSCRIVETLLPPSITKTTPLSSPPLHRHI